MRTESQIRILIGKEFRWIAVILVGVVILLSLRLILLESYHVSSPSMEPILHGSAEGGDHVFVNKLAFVWREPRRWEIVLFRRPGEKTTLVKRVVGLPGESIQIEGGEVLVGGEIVVKSLEEQEGLLVPVFEGDDPRSFDAFFSVEGGHVEHRPGRIEATPEVGSTLRIFTRAEVRDGHLDSDGKLVPGVHPVGDLLIDVTVTPGGPGELELLLRDGNRWMEVTLPFGEGEPRSGLPGARIQARPLPIGSPSRIRLAKIDERLTLRIGDTVALNQILGSRPARTETEESSAHNAVEVRLGGSKAVLSALCVRRDLYYTNEGRYGVGRPFTLGRDQYFLLGDNSKSSEDSRQFGAVPRKALVGLAFLRHWPPGRTRGL